MMKNKSEHLRSGRKQFSGAKAGISKKFFLSLFRLFKNLAPCVAKTFAYCLFLCAGLFSAAVLGALALRAEALPLSICVYVFFYFCGLVILIAAEYFTKKNMHFFAYASIATFVNISLIYCYEPELMQHFFANFLPQISLFTIGVFIFYLADYKPIGSDTAKKNHYRDIRRY